MKNSYTLTSFLKFSTSTSLHPLSDFNLVLDLLENGDVECNEVILTSSILFLLNHSADSEYIQNVNLKLTNLVPSAGGYNVILSNLIDTEVGEDEFESFLNSMMIKKVKKDRITYTCILTFYLSKIKTQDYRKKIGDVVNESTGVVGMDDELRGLVFKGFNYLLSNEGEN